MGDIFDYPERLARSTNAAQACAELVATMEPLGFTTYAIGALPHPDALFPTEFFHQNWPESWQRAYFERNFGERDPTMRAIACTGRPFTIQDIRQAKAGFHPTPEELEVMDFAAGIGLPHGYITPIYRAQGYSGIACLIGTGPDPDTNTRAKLQFIAEQTHDRLRYLSAVAAAGGSTVTLSPREIEVLNLAQHGLGDAAIAEAAGISIRTVRFHFENARRKLSARSRTEAIAVAVARHLLPG